MPTGKVIDDTKMTESREIPTVQTTVVGIGPTTSDHLPTGTVAITPGPAQPNLVVNVVTPIVAVSVRFVNTFLTTLTGLVIAAMASNAAGAQVIHATTFWHLVMDCATLSVASAGVGLLKDLVTIFGRLEGKYPLMTGNV